MSAVQVGMELNNKEDQQSQCGAEGFNACKASNSISAQAVSANVATATPTLDKNNDTNSQDEKVMLADKYKNQGNDYLKGNIPL